jgi:aminopeptidase N
MLVREVNRITGADYTSFFDQWVWGVGIPTFRYRWTSVKQPDGKYLITVRVSQDDKANVKKVLLPIHIHFKDKVIPQYKPIVQAEQEIKLMSPIEPKNVTLDDDRTLLAEFVKES